MLKLIGDKIKNSGTPEKVEPTAQSMPQEDDTTDSDDGEEVLKPQRKKTKVAVGKKSKVGGGSSKVKSNAIVYDSDDEQMDRMLGEQLGDDLVQI